MRSAMHEAERPPHVEDSPMRRLMLESPMDATEAVSTSMLMFILAGLCACAFFASREVCRRQVTRLKKDRENKAPVEGKDELSKEMRSDEFNLERIFVSTSTNGLALDNKYELACTSRRIFLFTLLLSSRASELRLPTAERLVEQARSAAAREQINRKCLPRNLSPRQFRRQKGDDVFLCDECSSCDDKNSSSSHRISLVSIFFGEEPDFLS